MKLSFARSGSRTGVFLLFSIIVVEAVTFTSAHYDRHVTTNLFSVLSVLLLLTALLFGFTANISKWGRVFWLVFTLGYIIFLGVGAYIFFYSKWPD